MTSKCVDDGLGPQSNYDRVTVEAKTSIRNIVCRGPMLPAHTCLIKIIKQLQSTILRSTLVFSALRSEGEPKN